MTSPKTGSLANLWGFLDALPGAEGRELEQRLLSIERLATLGTLTAGVAHDLNNPLFVLMTALDGIGLALDGIGLACLGAEGPAESCRRIGARLQEAVEAAACLHGMVGDLRTFSLVEAPAAGTVDANAVLASSLRMAGHEIHPRARLVTEYGAVPPVSGDAGRLGRVFLNLIVNAAQAMSEGRAEGNELRVVTRADGQSRVIVEISDTGHGIPAAVQARMFDPFFTTKAADGGTGLGLAICHRIVTALGGRITVESRVGRGTVVRTSLPAAPSPLAESPPAPPPTAFRPRARILVIDDEPLVVKALQLMLSLEHEVTVAASGGEALATFAAGDRFDLVFSDLMMPGMTGIEFYTALLRLAPNQAAKVVFITGGTVTNSAGAFLEQVPNRRLSKPFRHDDLKALIRDLLGPA